MYDHGYQARKKQDDNQRVHNAEYKKMTTAIQCLVRHVSPTQ